MGTEYRPGNRDTRIRKALKAEYCPHSLFGLSMVLFNDVIQVATRAHDESVGQNLFFLSLSDRCMRGDIAIERDLLGHTPLFNRLL
jgi:hypothetical protein